MEQVYSDSKRGIHYGWWIVLANVIICMTIVPIVMALQGLYNTQVTEEFGINQATFSGINTTLQLVGMFIAPFVAKYLAKGNLKLIQCGSIVGFALAYASYGIAPGVWSMYVSAFFIGVFYFSAALIPVAIIVRSWFLKKRGLAMALSMAGIGIGGFIFSPILTALLEHIGWRGSYAIMALIAVVLSLPLALFVIKQNPEKMGLKPYGAEDVAEQASQDVSSGVNTTQKKVRFGLKESVAKLFFILLVACFILNGVINIATIAHFPVAIKAKIDPGTAAWIISTWAIVGVVGKIAVGWISDKFGVITATLFCCVTFGSAFFFMFNIVSATPLFIMACIYGFGTPMSTVIPPLLVTSIYSGDKYPEMLGISQAAGQMGLALGGLLTGVLVDATNSYTLAWTVMIVVTAATFVSGAFAVILARRYASHPPIVQEQQAQQVAVA